MSVGKYSPTVSAAYNLDQKWWERNGGDTHVNTYDRDGYDSYGYDIDEIDRAGHTENDYMLTSEWIDDVFIHTLCLDVYNEWSTDHNGSPERK